MAMHLKNKRGNSSRSRWGRLLLRVPFLFLAFSLPGIFSSVGLAQAAPEKVVLAENNGIVSTAYWAPAERAGAQPAIIALHGCSGLFKKNGRDFDARYLEYTEWLHAAGYHVLLPDSFNPRGFHSVCTIKKGEPTVTPETRKADVLAALTWLKARPEVDARRIVILGWSHGAMTALTTMNRAASSTANQANTHDAQSLAGVAVFYPGCYALGKQPFRIDAPLLMQLGASDDWTAPKYCERLVHALRERQPEADVTLHVYPDSYHGFDSPRPVGFRRDVPNGVNPMGVHVGGNPVARAQALAALESFLQRVLQTNQAK